MILYKNIPYTPKLEKITCKSTRQRLADMIWLEKVGCAIVNYIKVDAFVPAHCIIDILNSSGQKGLIMQ